MNRGYMCLFELWFSQGTCTVVGLLGHMVVLFLVFFFFYIHTALQSGYISLHSHQLCQSFSFSPHLLQHLLFVDFLMMAILIVGLICICLMNDVELFSVFIGHLYVFFKELSV